MSIEVNLKMKVGDGVDAVKSAATLTVVNGNINASDTVTITPAPTEAVPTPVPVVFTEGVDFNIGVDSDATAESLRTLLDMISGVTATRVTNVVTVTVDLAGIAGNDWDLVTNNAPAFAIINFVNGRDADNPIDMEILKDQNGLVTFKFNNVLVGRVPFDTLFDTNTKTFEQNLRDFLRKSQC